jgi:hypothetical protein
MQLKQSSSQDQSIATVRHSNIKTHYTNSKDNYGGNNVNECIEASIDTNDNDCDISKGSFRTKGSHSTSSTTASSSHQHHSQHTTQITPYERDELIPALAVRSCHVPGNTAWQDYKQHMLNNHPIIGICCHHKLHPIGTKMRLWNLFSSIMFGLTVTNCMWLWFFYHNGIANVNDQHSIDPSVVVFEFQQVWDDVVNTTDVDTNTTNTNMTSTSVYNNDTNTTTVTQYDATTTSSEHDTNENIHINQGMLFLWTVGCTLHALYDIFIWYVEVCICCKRKHPTSTLYHRTKYQKCGILIVICTTLLCAVTATLAIVVRASIVADNDDDDEQHNIGSNEVVNSNSSYNNDTSSTLDDFMTNQYNITLFNTTTDVTILQQDASAYEFLLSYGVEMILALFLFYPLLETILFTGILGCCGYIPIIGGRPFEVRQHTKQQQQQKQQQEDDNERSI